MFIGFYGTRDLDATHAFYTAGLGLELSRDQGACRIYAVPGGGMVGFCLHLPVAVEGRSPILTFVTDDVDGRYDALLDAGYSAETAPATNERFRIYHFFARDPNGYLVEVQRFLD
ncbi:MAG: VOC family protein [Bacillota bacterium]|jgi:catechol 2,3-dioxygenase-like lactoylglutathione lyase family enzyme